MSDRFSNLERACGGKINPDTLRTFQTAMHEYNEFMRQAEALFAPREGTEKLHVVHKDPEWRNKL